MRRNRPRRRQVTVLHLEPTRATSTIAYTLMAVLAIAVGAAALIYPTAAWPQTWRPDTEISDRALAITAAVAGVFACLFATGAIVNGRRWHVTRAVMRLSNTPALAPFRPAIATSASQTRAALIPPLTVHFESPRKLPKPRTRLRRVELDRNVVGLPPMQIAFLRLFENQPRMRTFIEGPWREFGYAYFLRSAASVTPGEYKWAKRTRDFAALFVSTREQLFAILESGDRSPRGKGRQTFRAAGPTTIKVRDRYGSYPLQAVLCHGAFWKEAVDILLDRVDLVVLDLSGLTPDNLGTRYELQRVVDRVDIARILFLADQFSDRRFLTAQLMDVWSQMAAGSPNASAGARSARVAVTDLLYRHTSRDQQGHTSEQVRLVARRRQTRRVALMAQGRLIASRAMRQSPP